MNTRSTRASVRLSAGGSPVQSTTPSRQEKSKAPPKLAEKRKIPVSQPKMEKKQSEAAPSPKRSAAAKPRQTIVSPVISMKRSAQAIEEKKNVMSIPQAKRGRPPARSEPQSSPVVVSRVTPRGKSESSNYARRKPDTTPDPVVKVGALALPKARAAPVPIPRARVEAVSAPRGRLALATPKSGVKARDEILRSGRVSSKKKQQATEVVVSLDDSPEKKDRKVFAVEDANLEQEDDIASPQEEQRPAQGAAKRKMGNAESPPPPINIPPPIIHSATSENRQRGTQIPQPNVREDVRIESQQTPEETSDFPLHQDQTEENADKLPQQTETVVSPQIVPHQSEAASDNQPPQNPENSDIQLQQTAESSVIPVEPTAQQAPQLQDGAQDDSGDSESLLTVDIPPPRIRADNTQQQYNNEAGTEQGESWETAPHIEQHAPAPRRYGPPQQKPEEEALMMVDGNYSGPPIKITRFPAKDGGYIGRITVEAPNTAPDQPFRQTPLPGVADEVESYPCKFCPERVFLTSFGLERHTKVMHTEHIQEVMHDIDRIKEEWRKREEEREKQRERMALAKIRQEALAAAAARDAIHGLAGISHVLETSGARRVPSDRLNFGPDRSDPNGHDFGSTSSGMTNFESCQICGLLINAEHPTAMENHMRAHKKNDELRAHLVNTYGAQFVARVTCHECQLVFTDERKLIAHAEAMHVRRRKYVCKWCGHVCLTMSDLNNHKSEAHGMSLSRSKDRPRPPLGVQSAAVRRHVAMTDAGRATARPGLSATSAGALTSVEELPCRTTCDFCGLVMVKPSLLIRHMMRVHNRTNFTATVETKGMPPFKINVDRGKLSWTCCQEDFTDRNDFVAHRRQTHTPKFTPSLLNSAPTVSYSSAGRTMLYDQDSLSSQLRAANASGRDGQYVLLLTNDEDKAGVSTQSTDGQQGDQQQQEIVLTPQQLQELGISGEDADNLVLLIDDGNGNLTTPDGQPVVLQTPEDQQHVEPEEAEGEAQEGVEASAVPPPAEPQETPA